MNGAPFPPKSLFLTVTTTRIEGGQINQVRNKLIIFFFLQYINNICSYIE